MPASENPATKTRIGSCNTLKAKNPNTMTAKSHELKTALTNTGLYKALNSNPTTAALIPAAAPAIFGLDAKFCQALFSANTKRKPGKKIAKVAVNAPSKLWLGMTSAPKKVAMVNIGPGTAWANA